MTFCGLISQSVHANSWSLDDCRTNVLGGTGLNADEVKAICAAGPFFNIDVHWKPGLTIVILGERHNNDLQSFNAGKDLIDMFSLRGLEFGPENLKWWQKALLLPLQAISFAGDVMINTYKHITFNGDSINQGSMMKYAYDKGYFLYFDMGTEITYLNGIKEGPEPLLEFRKRSVHENQTINIHIERNLKIGQTVWNECGISMLWSQSCDPKILLDLRNESMVEGIEQMSSLFADHSKIIVVLGASHLPGVTRSLHCVMGYNSAPVTRGLTMQFPEHIPLDAAAQTGTFCL